MSAARKRQTFGLGEALEPLRPWSDEAATARVLRTWCAGRKGADALGEGHYREVAANLRFIGRGNPTLDAEEIDGAAFHMLRNVIAGREATDYGSTFDLIRGPGGPAPRTRRRYTQRHGYRAGLVWLTEALQYDVDLTALVRGGRSEAAARRWLQRNPGLHAKDAPRPRKRRAA